VDTIKVLIEAGLDLELAYEVAEVLRPSGRRQAIKAAIEKVQST
jgi:hypothetical protein